MTAAVIYEIVTILWILHDTILRGVYDIYRYIYVLCTHARVYENEAIITRAMCTSIP